MWTYVTGVGVRNLIFCGHHKLMDGPIQDSRKCEYDVDVDDDDDVI